MSKNSLSKALDNFSRLLAGQPLFVRSIYAETLLEDFFVSAIAALLAIRLYLSVTGYPQLSIGPLHIAHMIWGGFFMLVALAMLLSFLNHRAQVIAAVLGGIGFGAFIDELGKFITRDNNYFFQPAVAVIYVVFVLIFFGMRSIGRRQAVSSQQCLANAFDIAMQATLSGLDQEQRDHALELLEKTQHGPVRDHLEAILHGMQVAPVARFRLLARTHALIDKLYFKAASRWWFSSIVVGVFALTAVTSLSAVVVVVQWSWGLSLWIGAGMAILAALVWLRRVHVRYLNIMVPAGIVIISILINWGVLGTLKHTPLSVIDWAQFIFPSISGVLIVIGVLTLTHSRLHAYMIFRPAMLVSIFFTQVLSFYEHQFLALLGLMLDILILGALRYMITHEHEKIENGSVT
jgi:hypothetical protein